MVNTNTFCYACRHCSPCAAGGPQLLGLPTDACFTSIFRKCRPGARKLNGSGFCFSDSSSLTWPFSMPARNPQCQGQTFLLHQPLNATATDRLLYGLNNAEGAMNVKKCNTSFASSCSVKVCYPFLLFALLC